MLFLSQPDPPPPQKKSSDLQKSHGCLFWKWVGLNPPKPTRDPATALDYNNISQAQSLYRQLLIFLIKNRGGYNYILFHDWTYWTDHLFYKTLYSLVVTQ